VAQPCHELEEQLKQEPVLNSDETGWRSDGERRYLWALAERHLDSEDRAVRNLATALFQHCDRLFTFIEFPGVEPTNNVVERALRIAVQWRKTSFGNRSAQGEIATARLLTVSQTCRMQGRSALIYLSEAVSCHRQRVSVPSLLVTAR
jgi:transposase